MHPVSVTSRPVRLLIAENDIEVDEAEVDEALYGCAEAVRDQPFDNT
jgi:hypothetical protein